MKAKILLALMISMLIIQGCTTLKVMKMTAVASRDQKVGFQETITSKKKHFVSLAPYSDLKLIQNKIMFMMVVQNCGNEPINIDYNNISVTFEEKSRKGTSNRINLQSLDEFMNGFEEEYRNNVNASIYNSLDGLIWMLRDIISKRILVFVEGAYQMQYSVKKAKEGIVRMHREYQLLLGTLPDFAMQPQTIIPGYSYAGVVLCDTRQMNPTIKGNFKITVSVDSEEHQFTFRRAISK